MKSTTAFFTILAVFVFSSCKKEAEDRIPGDWNMVVTTTEVETKAGESPETYSESGTGTATFNDDGTGTLTVYGEVLAVTWTATEDKVTLIVDGDALILDIVENGKNTQEWKVVEKVVMTNIHMKRQLSLNLQNRRK